MYYTLRFRYDREKSRVVKRRHGVSLKDTQENFDQAYLVDQKNDDPEQFPKRRRRGVLSPRYRMESDC